jgi:hypothetical protein
MICRTWTILRFRTMATSRLDPDSTGRRGAKS